MLLSPFQEAVKMLYGLQSNTAYLQSVLKHNLQNDYNKLKKCEEYLHRTGITLEQLDKLSIIHVAGTKGKGSTCSYTESILRKHGFRTGFFSSPHLVSVRERIRIDGQPLSESEFACHFWKVYNKLKTAKDDNADMPTYFQFLTVLMFHIFLQMDIDVAIIEVGIGGELDSTNIIRTPVCIGISSLSLDHTALLGNTIQEIAHQKSGIFKSKCTAFTVPQQEEAMQVLKKRAAEKNCKLRVVPPFQQYPWKNYSVFTTLNDVQMTNASLAIQLAIEWMKSEASKRVFLIPSADITEKPYSSLSRDTTVSGNGLISSARHNTFHNTTTLPIPDWEKVALGISFCKWPGRTQILRGHAMDFFLDGAHTMESMKCCISWYDKATEKSEEQRILIFNMSGTRDSAPLLMLLKKLNFRKAYFAPNYAGISSTDDELNSGSLDEQKSKCKKNAIFWGEDSLLADSVMDAILSIKESGSVKLTPNCKNKPQILITGSLYLVGAALAILDPDLNMTTDF